jgi:hypothetical protein
MWFVRRMAILRFIVLFIPIFFLGSCYSTFLTNSTETYQFNEQISFKITKVQEGSSISTGNGYWRPSRGNKFVFIYVTFTNSSTEKQDLNLDNLALADISNKVKYKVEFNMVDGPINLWGKVDSSIKGNDSRNRKLVFSFPEKAKPEYLISNGTLVKIPYL